MKPRWVFHKLSSHLPSRAFSVSQFRNLIPQNPSSEALIFWRNRVDILSALAVCGRQGDIHLGRSLHASILKNFEHYDGSSNLRHSLLVWNSLLSMYGKCGQIADAALVFDEMPVKDTVSWNTMISIHLKARDFHLGFRFFKRLHESGVYRLDPATLNTLLVAYDSSELCNVNVMLHGLVFLSGYEHEIIVGNGLLTSYFRCGCCSYGMRVFDEMLKRNVVTWTAAISGLAQNQVWEDGMGLFVEMRRGPVDPNNLTYLSSLTFCSGMHALREGCQIHGLICKLGLKSNIHIESALMDMYAKYGSVDDALQIFESACLLKW